MDASEQLVSLIRDLIREEISKKDTSAICRINSVNQNGTLNIVLLSDPDTVIPNIKNTSQYEFEAGDYGVLYKIENKLNNAFIFSKVITPPPVIVNEKGQKNIDSGLSYIVEDVKGVPYGFVFDASTGYYVSQNKEGELGTYALCKIVFNGNGTVVMKGISNGHTDSNFGIVGNVNQELSKSDQQDTNVKFSFKGADGAPVQIVFNIRDGDFVMCKYRQMARSTSIKLNNFMFKFLPYLEVRGEHVNEQFETKNFESVIVQ